MSLSPHQQLEKLLETSQHILILLPSDPQGDTLAAAWALALHLEEHQHQVTVAADGLIHAKARYDFLTEPKNVTETLTGARDFVLSFNTQYNKIIATRTEEEGDEYRIYITPEHGSIDPRDFSFIPAKFKFDLTIVLGAPDKESLGKLYESNADLFYEMPVVNIDNHPRNENFGQINFVDMTASSCSEIVAGILEKLSRSPLTETASEALLAGIILATDSFQKRNTTPRALQAASHLMDQGADQQKIVRCLYKTQPLHILKLWGRIMSQLHWHESVRLLSAPVTDTDLAQAQANEHDLPVILEKIRAHYSAGLFFLIVFEKTPNTLQALLKTASPDTLIALQNLWPKGEIRNDVFVFSPAAKHSEDAEKEILDHIKKFLGSGK